MRYSTSGMILAAMTIGEAVAGPTHAHMHRHLHAKKDTYDVDWAALDWQDMGIDWSSAWAAGQKTSTSATPVAVATPTTTAVAQPATTTAAAPVATTTTASTVSASVEGLFSEVSELFNELVGVSNYLTSFGEATTPSGTTGDDYIGNIGSPYGSNIILTDSPSSYQFTNTFQNTQSETITVNVWQKVGPDGRPLSGSALAPTQTTLTFTLAPGQSKTVAFQENTQVGWAQACSSTTASGAYDITWGEANFVPSGSGYDVSAIENSAGNNYAMTITSTEAPDCTSDMTQNMWLTATDPVGGSDGSCFIAQTTATLTTIMGGFV